MHQNSDNFQVAMEEVQDVSMLNEADEKRNIPMKEVQKDAQDEELQKVDRPETSKVLVESLHDAQEGIQICRVCQFVDPEQCGEAALKSLGICSPPYSRAGKPIRHVQSYKGGDGMNTVVTLQRKIIKNDENSISKDAPCLNNSLIDLGCACRSDLSLAHYACALRWFVWRDSLACEICGVIASNIKAADRDKVISALKQRDMLPCSSTHGLADAERLSAETMTPFSPVDGECGLNDVSWFDPHGTMMQNMSDRIIYIPEEMQPSRSTSPAIKWAMEGAGVLVATGLLTMTITSLLAPRVSKGIARNGLNILLAGLCAFAIVIFLRLGILPRIREGSPRYWAISVAFWFLIFGVWASSTRSARASP